MEEGRRRWGEVSAVAEDIQFHMAELSQGLFAENRHLTGGSDFLSVHATALIDEQHERQASGLRGAPVLKEAVRCRAEWCATGADRDARAT